MAAGTPDLRGGPHGHAVLFYQDGGELAGQVSAHLLEALRAGGVAVVIATPAHRAAIAAELARAGVDVAHRSGGRPLRRAGRDRDDGPVHGRRLAERGQLLAGDQPGASAGRPGPESPCTCSARWLRLLWDFGQVNAAIEVEAMWNEIGAQYPFSLLCAYPAELGERCGAPGLAGRGVPRPRRRRRRRARPSLSPAAALAASLNPHLRCRSAVAGAGQGARVHQRPVARHDRGDDRRRGQHLHRPGAPGLDGRAVAAEGPRADLAVEEQAGPAASRTMTPSGSSATGAR